MLRAPFQPNPPSSCYYPSGIADILTRLFIHLSPAKPSAATLFRKPTTYVSLQLAAFVITIHQIWIWRVGERSGQNANYYRFDDSFQWSSLAAVGHRCQVSGLRARREREGEKFRKKDPLLHDQFFSVTKRETASTDSCLVCRLFSVPSQFQFSNSIYCYLLFLNFKFLSFQTSDSAYSIKSLLKFRFDCLRVLYVYSRELFLLD